MQRTDNWQAVGSFVLCRRAQKSSDAFLEIRSFCPLLNAFKQLLDRYRLPPSAVATLALVLTVSTVIMVSETVTVMLLVYAIVHLR